LEALSKIPKDGRKIFLITERHMRTDKLFYYNVYKNKLATELEWNTYKNFFGIICASTNNRVNVMFHVKTDVGICEKRIAKRDRTEECNLPKQLLPQLEKSHEEMFQEARDQGIRVITINFNEDMTPEQMDKVVHPYLIQLLKEQRK